MSNDADYYSARAASARALASRSQGYVRDIHLQMAQLYAERVERAMVVPAPTLR